MKYGGGAGDGGGTLEHTVACWQSCDCLLVVFAVVLVAVAVVVDGDNGEEEEQEDAADCHRVVLVLKGCTKMVCISGRSLLLSIHKGGSKQA